MSLNKMDVVPCDTHVWQITATRYMPTLRKSKSVTAKLYKEIGIECPSPFIVVAHRPIFPLQAISIGNVSAPTPAGRTLFSSALISNASLPNNRPSEPNLRRRSKTTPFASDRSKLPFRLLLSANALDLDLYPFHYNWELSNILISRLRLVYYQIDHIRDDTR